MIPDYPNIAIDIVSIGSLSRPDYLQVQQDTFGQHPSIRHFWAITEDDDVEKDCNANLTWLDLKNISKFCGLQTGLTQKHKVLHAVKKMFYTTEDLGKKSNPVGWMCAQKRPMSGLHKVLQFYSTQQEPLPDFLIFMDDDTYYNMNQVVPNLMELRQQLLENYRDDSMVLTGCLIRVELETLTWIFPFGGWGTIFSKGALQSLTQPLHCSSASRNTSVFGKTICSQLLKNQIGEYQVYRDGMSLAEIMHAYAFNEPYSDHKNWKLGFCMHSDWVWGYFSNFYNISIPIGRQSDKLSVDRIGAYNLSEINHPEDNEKRHLERQCKLKTNEACTMTAHMCHYIDPIHMKNLWTQQQ